MNHWNTFNYVKIVLVWILAVPGNGNRVSDAFVKTRVEDGFRHHETSVPELYSGEQRIRSTLLNGRHIHSVTVIIHAHNQRFVVDLVKNTRLIPASYVERHFGNDGQEIVNRNIDHNRRHCYYHGNLRGEKAHLAALSTCNGGLRGYVSDGDHTYYIEPRTSEGSGATTELGFEHWVLRDSDRVPDNLTCAGHEDQDVSRRIYKENLPKAHRMKRELHWPAGSTNRTKVLELYMVNDKSQYVNFNYNLEVVIFRTVDIVNIVSSLYRPLDIYVALVGIEVWTDTNKITILQDALQTMSNFLEYRRTNIAPRYPNDNAQLIIGSVLGDGVVGKAPIMTMCSWQHSGGVSMDHSETTTPVAATVTHEIGHNFGLNHDNVAVMEECRCPDTRCIMSSRSGGLKSPTKWSSCSMEQFNESFIQGLDYCLHNLPQELYGGPECGNGFLDDKEECDCGLPQDCTSNCCDPLTCRLTTNATCATGACCDLDTCQIKPPLEVCREAVGPCDLPELCNGEEEFCPSDVYKRDSTPCQDEHETDSYCYHGKCNSHDSQCRLLWGDTGRKANPQCFRYFNVMGSTKGNCGFTVLYSNFTRCALQDVECGMLQCVHRNEKLMFWKETLAFNLPEGWITTAGRREDCKGAILDVGLDMPDPGMTPDGAKCGNDMMCVHQKCIPIENVTAPKCPDCHAHGVCNSLGLCHCDPGYSPPYCDKPGDGGSVLKPTPPSSGTPPSTDKGSNKSLVIGLCVFFLLILPLICLIVFLVACRRQRLKAVWSTMVNYKYRWFGGAADEKKTPPSDVVDVTEIYTVPISVYDSKPRNDIVKPPVPPPPKERPVSLTRHPSFRPEDISSPRLQSSTNKNLHDGHRVIYKPKNSRGADAASPDATIVPARPAPSAPAARPDAGDAGGKVPPTRPAPPRADTKPPRPPLPVPSDTPVSYSASSSAHKPYNTDSSLSDSARQPQYENASRIRPTYMEQPTLPHDEPQESHYYNAAPPCGVYMNSRQAASDKDEMVGNTGKKPLPAPKKPPSASANQDAAPANHTHGVASLRSQFQGSTNESQPIGRKPVPNTRPSQLAVSSRTAPSRPGQSVAGYRPGQSAAGYRPGKTDA